MKCLFSSTAINNNVRGKSAKFNFIIAWEFTWDFILQLQKNWICLRWGNFWWYRESNILHHASYNSNGIYEFYVSSKNMRTQQINTWYYKVLQSEWCVDPLYHIFNSFLYFHFSLQINHLSTFEMMYEAMEKHVSSLAFANGSNLKESL